MGIFFVLLVQVSILMLISQSVPLSLMSDIYKKRAADNFTHSPSQFNVLTIYFLSDILTNCEVPSLSSILINHVPADSGFVDRLNIY